MQKTYQIMILVIAAVLPLAGCAELMAPANSMTHSEPGVAPPPAAQREISDPARFQNSADRESALDSAIELSKKFAALSEEMAKMQAEKEQLVVENKELKLQIEKLYPEAEQARKELAEANDLLVEMRIELNNWKSDVLGFREEIREADKIQLEALLKILRVLGGEEVSADAAAEANGN